MKVFINENLSFHVIFEKTFDLEYLFIKLFIIVALTKFAIFLIGFKLLLSDLRSQYLHYLVDCLDYSKEYHKEYQINYLLINLIDKLFKMSLMYEAILQSTSLNNYKIIRLNHFLGFKCLIRSQVSFQKFAIITIGFISVESNQAR